MNKNNFYFMIIYFLTLLINCQNISDSTADSNNSKGNNFNSTYLWSSSVDYDALLFSNEEYKLYNNVWGKGNITNYSETVFYNNDNDFGWRWDWPNVPSITCVKAAPDVFYGQSPWWGTSTTTKLPDLVSNSNFTMEVSTIQILSGQYDTYYDIWFTDSPDPNYNSIPIHLKSELMIWLNCANYYTNYLTSGIKVVIDGEPYTIMYDPCHVDPITGYNWTSCIYIRHNMTSSTTLNLSSFLNDMVNRGYIQSNWYVTDIEFGNEIGYGKGETKVTHYKITKH